MDRFFVNNLWRWKCGLPEIEDTPVKKIDLDYLEKTQWSPRFEKLMRNRLIMGAIRYGTNLGTIPKKKSKHDLVYSIERRIQLYKETGNAEFLVDAANYCLLEFENETHPNFHFCSTDDGEHSKKL